MYVTRIVPAGQADRASPTIVNGRHGDGSHTALRHMGQACGRTLTETPYPHSAQRNSPRGTVTFGEVVDNSGAMLIVFLLLPTPTGVGDTRRASAPNVRVFRARPGGKSWR
jgi:hypothetical protein